METALSFTKRQRRQHSVLVKFKVRQSIIHETLHPTRENDALYKIFSKMSILTLSDFSKFFKNLAPMETTLSDTKRSLRLRLVRLSAVSVCAERSLCWRLMWRKNRQTCPQKLCLPRLKSFNLNEIWKQTLLYKSYTHTRNVVTFWENLYFVMCNFACHHWAQSPLTLVKLSVVSIGAYWD